MRLTWSNTNMLGKNKYLTSSYLWVAIVPIVTSMFNEVNNLSIKFMGNNIKLNLAMPFSWHFFYFAALLVAIGKTIYSGCCPEIIKHFSTYREFNDTGRGKTALISYLTSYLKMQNDCGRDDIINYFCLTYCSSRASSEVDKLSSIYKANILDDKMGDAFYYIRGLYENNKQLSLNLCLIFYLIGLLLVAVVVGQNSFLVGKSFLRAMGKFSS